MYFLFIKIMAYLLISRSLRKVSSISLSLGPVVIGLLIGGRIGGAAGLAGAIGLCSCGLIIGGAAGLAGAVTGGTPGFITGLTLALPFQAYHLTRSLSR
jgi:hypothetical protein